MKTIEREIPKHRKHGRRKPWVVIWHWQGNPSKLSSIQRCLVKNWKERYTTERAARQAHENWVRGSGTWGGCRRPPEWTAFVTYEA